ncbi:unnamed protein product [Linum tenue]|uniref:Uncharacterized protein n=1 Tax=Linum tenue TaxID=586396 RepID=A0AAV0HL48_9ROSI|nr:unnamed protein product [Linum tenue]
MASKACILLFVLVAACLLVCSSSSGLRLSATKTSPLPSTASVKVDGVHQAAIDTSPPAPLSSNVAGVNGDEIDCDGEKPHHNKNHDAPSPGDEN